MAIVTLAPIGTAVGIALTDLMPAVPAGKAETMDVRVCNVGAADSTIGLYMVDTVTGANSHYVWRNEPVPFNQEGSGFDLERGLELPAGWKLQGIAGSAATLEISLRNRRRRDA